MIVVADTTPLNYLILIDRVSLLKALCGRVVIPPAVVSELKDDATPGKVRSWIRNHPDWLEVRYTTVSTDPSLAHLDGGERDTIILAQEVSADFIVDPNFKTTE